MTRINHGGLDLTRNIETEVISKEMYIILVSSKGYL